MKVLMINGSPREQGNTALALAEMRKVFEKEGIEAEVFNIGREPVTGCRSCGACVKLGKCVIDDAVNVLAEKLAEYGVCVSVKTACSADGKPSRAVFAVSKDRKNALSSWRISLSHLTSDAEIGEFLEIFHKCYGELLP